MTALMLNVPLDRSFWGCSSQPISWIVLRKKEKSGEVKYKNESNLMTKFLAILIQYQHVTDTLT